MPFPPLTDESLPSITWKAAPDQSQRSVDYDPKEFPVDPERALWFAKSIYEPIKLLNQRLAHIATAPSPDHGPRILLQVAQQVENPPPLAALPAGSPPQDPTLRQIERCIADDFNGKTEGIIVIKVKGKEYDLPINPQNILAISRGLGPVLQAVGADETEICQETNKLIAALPDSTKAYLRREAHDATARALHINLSDPLAPTPESKISDAAIIAQISRELIYGLDQQDFNHNDHPERPKLHKIAAPPFPGTAKKSKH